MLITLITVASAISLLAIIPWLDRMAYRRVKIEFRLEQISQRYHHA